MSEPKTKLFIFSAKWCGPCKALAPIVEKVSKLYPSLAVTKIDVEENPSIASKYHVLGLPKLILEKDGKIISEHTGFIAEENLKRFIADLDG